MTCVVCTIKNIQNESVLFAWCENEYVSAFNLQQPHAVYELAFFAHRYVNVLIISGKLIIILMRLYYKPKIFIFTFRLYIRRVN